MFMRLDIIEKYKEYMEKYKELGRIPAATVTAPRTNSLYTATFSDGTDMGNWRIRLKNKKTKTELEKKVLARLDFFAPFERKLTMVDKYEQYIEKCRELGRPPARDTVNEPIERSCYIAKFSDGTDMGNWRSNLRQREHKTLEEQEILRKLDSFVPLERKLTLEEKCRQYIEKSIQLGRMPVRDIESYSNTSANALYIAKFSDGTDMGNWRNYLNRKENKTLEEQAILEKIDSLVPLSKYLKKLTIEEKCEEYLKQCQAFGRHPLVDQVINQNKEAHIYIAKFSDGTDMGNWRATLKRKENKSEEEKVILEKIESITFTFPPRELDSRGQETSSLEENSDVSLLPFADQLSYYMDELENCLFRHDLKMVPSYRKKIQELQKRVNFLLEEDDDIKDNEDAIVLKKR